MRHVGKLAEFSLIKIPTCPIVLTHSLARICIHAALTPKFGHWKGGYITATITSTAAPPPPPPTSLGYPVPTPPTATIHSILNNRTLNPSR